MSRFLQSLFPARIPSSGKRQTGPGRPITRNSSRRRRPMLEQLETRRLLANDLAVLSDEFDDATSIVQWQRVNEVEGWNADQLEAWNINGDTPGAMNMVPNTVVWYQDYRGPMAFQEVTGDFVVTTHIAITDRDDVGGSDADDIPGDGLYSLGGVMIRTPRAINEPADWAPGSRADDGTNNGENYVFLSLGHGGGDNQFSFEVKTTRNSESNLELTPLGPTANQATVQIARIGDAVITLVRMPDGPWQVHRRYDRADMPETLQVGLVTYSDYGKASDFDPFYHNGNALDGSFDPTPGTPFNPDLNASFDYARYVRPEVPVELEGLDLVSEGTDEQLLAFLGENANTPADGGEGELPDVGDHSVVHDQALQLLLAETHDGQALSYEFEMLGDDLYQLDQQHDLFSEGDYFDNWGGQDERWLQGAEGWYYLLPNGDFHQWMGDFESSELLGQLGADVYDDPSQLHDAVAPAEWHLDGYTLIVTPNANFVGQVEMLATVGDGENSEVETVVIDVTNAAPTVDPIGPQSMPASQDTLAVDYQASDADGDTVVVEAVVLQSEHYQLDQQYGFQSDGEYYENWAGQSERWIQDAEGAWYFLLPDGSLNAWGGSFESSTEIAQLGAATYDDPTQLTDAQATPVSAAIVGGQIIVDPSDLYVGDATVVVTGSDGLAETSVMFVVSVQNAAPVIDPIDDQSMSGGQLTLDVPVQISDADGDPLEVSTTVLDPAYDLDQSLGLWSDGEFFENWGGQQERWLRDAEDAWHYILPSGQVYRWEGSFESSTLLASLDDRYYDDPLLLANAEPIAASAMHSDGIVTVERDASLTGTIVVQVAVTDGFEVVYRLFSIELA